MQKQIEIALSRMQVLMLLIEALKDRQTWKNIMQERLRKTEKDVCGIFKQLSKENNINNTILF